MAIVKDGRVLAIGPPRELGVGGGAGGERYRVAYRRDADGELVEQRDRRPDRAAARADRAGARPRAGAWRSCQSGGPTLEDVYLELTADA